MPGFDDRQDPSRYEPASARTQEEVGGMLERAFRQEGGRRSREEEVRRFLALADEAEARAETAESLAREAEEAAERAAERHALSGEAGDLAALERWQAEAEIQGRQVEHFREEAERLRKYA